MKAMICGYARVSTAAPDETGQVRQLKATGCEKVFREKVTGITADRPQLAKLMKALAPGDVVITPAVDRLSRDTPDLLVIARDMQKAGAGIRSLAEPCLNTTSDFAEIVFAILGIADAGETQRSVARSYNSVRARFHGRHPKKGTIPKEGPRMTAYEAGVPSRNCRRPPGAVIRIRRSCMIGASIARLVEYKFELSTVDVNIWVAHTGRLRSVRHGMFRSNWPQSVHRMDDPIRCAHIYHLRQQSFSISRLYRGCHLFCRLRNQGDLSFNYPHSKTLIRTRVSC
jgi:DNA invertase Pin-like site-specific DNA recombinase